MKTYKLGDRFKRKGIERLTYKIVSAGTNRITLFIEEKQTVCNQGYSSSVRNSDSITEAELREHFGDHSFTLLPRAVETEQYGPEGTPARDNYEARVQAAFEKRKAERQTLADACDNLFMEVSKSLHIPQLVDWLAKKLS